MEKQQENTFVQGKILQPLIVFALPVLFALFLQAMYGAVDLLIVGKFASPADMSAVSTGSQIMMTLTNLVSSFAMGTTILLGQQIGCGERKNCGRTVGTATVMFAVLAVAMTAVLVLLAPQISSIMNAPAEAFAKTASYVRICGAGMLVIVAYIGLATPLSSIVQLLLCLGFMVYLKRKNQNKRFSKDVKPERPLPPSALTRSHCSPSGALRHLPRIGGVCLPGGGSFVCRCA